MCMYVLLLRLLLRLLLCLLLLSTGCVCSLTSSTVHAVGGGGQCRCQQSSKPLLVVKSGSMVCIPNLLQALRALDNIQPPKRHLVG